MGPKLETFKEYDEKNLQPKIKAIQNAKRPKCTPQLLLLFIFYIACPLNVVFLHFYSKVMIIFHSYTNISSILLSDFID